jgi:hypothetical protein
MAEDIDTVFSSRIDVSTKPLKDVPVKQSTKQPTDVLIEQPTEVPTQPPKGVPTTDMPLEQPTEVPTEQPTDMPTDKPKEQSMDMYYGPTCPRWQCLRGWSSRISYSRVGTSRPSAHLSRQADGSMRARHTPAQSEKVTLHLRRSCFSVSVVKLQVYIKAALQNRRSPKLAHHKPKPLVA